MLAGGAAAKVWAVACTGASLVAKGLTLATKGLGVALRFLCLNPVGLAVTAIAGLVAAGVALYKNWDTVNLHEPNVGSYCRCGKEPDQLHDWHDQFAD